MSEHLIKQVQLIDNFTDQDISLFLGLLEGSYLLKGEHFLKEGQISRHFAFIIEGLTMLYQIQDGVEIPCEFIKENEWVGYLKSFSTASPSDMNIKALEDTKLLRISAENLTKLFHIQPKFMLVKNYYTEYSFFTNAQHANDLSMLSAKQRYYKFIHENYDLSNRIPQYLIAAYLGIKPQSLSRLRK
ncbi:Crp/Fnr family transcriptional regulator [Segetibacter sp. 3557_3]|uniref:Crp/Fnr family transcriptional regulator n=1 Tax=Segetibacter sp. 3557_3 TaxID=2547429 RepID=UPI001058B39E|nr:Crp/Fnr family transcriptional regulator [Segetibacter sp. 3557_3]TDH18076.1 Crp/Fnr family transcriptional regulator [Segetibacter sp. 3557_3]